MQSEKQQTLPELAPGLTDEYDIIYAALNNLRFNLIFLLDTGGSLLPGRGLNLVGQRAVDEEAAGAAALDVTIVVRAPQPYVSLPP